MEYPSRNTLIRQEVDQLLSAQIDITQDELINAIISIAYKAGYVDGEADASEPDVYCPECGSCGESGCCPPDKCHTVDLVKCFEEIADDYSDGFHQIVYNSIKNRVIDIFKHGSYCDSNISDYKEMSRYVDTYYVALDIISKAKHASEMIAIANKALNYDE